MQLSPHLDMVLLKDPSTVRNTHWKMKIYKKAKRFSEMCAADCEMLEN